MALVPPTARRALRPVEAADRPEEAHLGETGPLSQHGVQAGGKALRIRHTNGVEVREKMPRGFKLYRYSEPPEPPIFLPEAHDEEAQRGDVPRRGAGAGGTVRHLDGRRCRGRGCWAQAPYYHASRSVLDDLNSKKRSFI